MIAVPLFSLAPSRMNAECHEFLGRVVGAAQAYLGADVAFLAEFDGAEKVIRHSAGNAGAAGFAVGRRFPLSETYCQRVVSGDLPEAVYDARQDDRVRDLPITTEMAIDTYIGIPVSLGDGCVLGTLCCANFDGDRADRVRDVRFMRFLAELIGTQLSRLQQADAARQRRIDAVQQVLDAGGPRMVFQPIVALDGGAVVGVEALARFDLAPTRSPDAWFREAWEVGLGAELELAALRSAIAQLDRVPAHAYLSVNVSPAALGDSSFAGLLAGVPADRLVIEITEHAVVDDYVPLVDAVKRLRADGFRIAIDDVGAGYSGLRHILHIAPQIAKLDMSLTRGIDADPVKQALAIGVAAFASRTGLQVVAEGIETVAEAEALAAIGIPYGQGYLFARPTALPLQSSR